MVITLLIADDHPLVREGLRQTFACTEIEVVGAASTVAEAWHSARSADANVVLLDLSWDREGRETAAATHAGFALLEQIRAARPATAILVYSIYERADYMDHCRRLGADGYLVKGVDDRRLVTAVREAYANRQSRPRGRGRPNLARSLHR